MPWLDMDEKSRLHKKIIFVSEMRNPKKTSASSTQIMTRNLLFGFNKISETTIFVPILASRDDFEDVRDYYSDYCDIMVFKHSITHFGSHPIGSRLSMFFHTVFRRFLSMPKGLKELIDDNAIVVSHSPSIDGALLCEKIKRWNRTVRYVQYWGDPIALSLIAPSEYSFKRSIQKFVEKTLHKKADKIVFGTKSLYDAQMKLFPEIGFKSSSVEVSYSPYSLDCGRVHNRPVIGYFGNYYSNIRNIIPFYEAACEIENAEFVICGSGNIDLSPKDNIRVLKRVPQSEISVYEQDIDISICILNLVGIQIPGKVFYQTNTQKDILVILDGPNKENIQNELKESNRFLFSENDKESVKNSIINILENKTKRNYLFNMYSPENICEQIVEGS